MLVSDVVTRMLRLTAETIQTSSPDNAKLTVSLTALNTLKMAMFGTLIGPRLSPQDLPTILSGVQAENGGLYQVPAVAYTITAPANPRSGSRFAVADAALNFATTNCTIQGNGRLINGSASPYVLSANGAGASFFFNGSSAGWVLETEWANAASVIEFPDSLAAYLPYMLAVALGPDFGKDPDPAVVAFATQGVQAFARTYGRRGSNALDPVIGLAAPQSQQAR